MFQVQCEIELLVLVYSYSLHTQVLCYQSKKLPPLRYDLIYYARNVSSKLAVNTSILSWCTSCSSFSFGTISFKLRLTSICSSDERTDIIHGKKSSNSVTGTLHMNCQTSEACLAEQNCCISKGKTCTTNVYRISTNSVNAW